MKRVFGREAGLMLAPVALLTGRGRLLRAHKPAVFVDPRPFVPFIWCLRVLPAASRWLRWL